ncbi:hypothetical protein M5K25_002532 [Dendrobium thyrsiflorum]|uniref:Uncharacterized protein n=1 Tax=Dendrobium thyrsiflorum TaxID=117978 RepID=A0ABD0VUV3_DENTH
MRNGTNQAAMFTAKNAFDVILWKKHEGDGKVLQPWQSMISGFLAGTCGPICTGPFDVVKTRLMAQSKFGGELKYKGMIHAIRTISVEEGVLALWKGLLPRLMRIPPGQAIMWAVADQITGRGNEDDETFNKNGFSNWKKSSRFDLYVGRHNNVHNIYDEAVRA